MQESIKINGMFRHRITSTVHHLTDISSVNGKVSVAALPGSSFKPVHFTLAAYELLYSFNFDLRMRPPSIGSANQ